MNRWLTLVALTASSFAAEPFRADEPSAQSLIERHLRENSPVWVDGDVATFFFRGEAEHVRLFFGGEEIALKRLTESDVWTATVAKPDLAKAVFTYAIMPGKKYDAVPTKGVTFQHWRGPKGPPPVAHAKDLKGQLRTLDFASQSLGEKRKVRVYLPPGHDPKKTYPVIYATDGNDGAHVLEPLILAGKVPPLIAVATSSGGYLGERTAEYDTKKDLRALEYLSGFDDKRYAAHEKFFCEEVRTWAEREFGATNERSRRAVFGCSNGGRFAVDMGTTHPELFGHVFGFSVAGRRELRMSKSGKLPYFHLAAGTWEPFLKMTQRVSEEARQRGAQVTMVTRVAGHDMLMWEEELVAATIRAFGNALKPN